MNQLCRHALAIFMLVGTLFTPLAHATIGAPGTLDPFWGNGIPLGAGKVITSIGGVHDDARAMTLQPDGKVLVAGACLNGGTYDFCAARYNGDGTLDLTWNGTGKVITALGGEDFAQAVAVQPDGKVLLAGSCTNGGNNNFCAARYNANGTLDITWNVTGIVITAIGSGQTLTQAIMLQPDGKVLLSGSCFNGINSDFCAVRYNGDGTLDINWNGTGKVITDMGGNNDGSYAIALQPNGKVLLAGTCSNGTYGNFCAARYNVDGTLDITWNGNGKVITAIGSFTDTARAMTLQPDGKVLLGGLCFNAAYSNFCAARYNANGTLDTTWNSTGKVITLIGSGIGSNVANAMALQPDGRVLLAGYCFNDVNNDFCAVRYLSNGALDTTWNGTGTVTTAIGTGYDVANAITLQPDGKVLLAGECLNGTNSNVCVARYDSGPFVYQICKPDLDGDGLMTATVDGLIYLRVMFGLTGSTVLNGISFPPAATRNTWPLIRDYLVSQCGMSLAQ